MVAAILTFQDIIRLNENDWDRAYEVLNYHLEIGDIIKDVVQGGQVICHNSKGIQECDLIHGRIILPKPVITETVTRPQRKRINRDRNTSAT
ncbi:hypothetical protein [Algoriphagus aquimarinus]|uniref:hypothetical protein n=1 Tax=Algoriphagus aquimarinus TaxID=237018 RepID=UPI0030DB0F44